MAYPEGLSIHTIWDEIAYFLDSTEDLLSLALTCHTFKQLIIPYHLEYRRIRCDLRRIELWKSLANRRRLTRGIRVVELIYERSTDNRTYPLTTDFLANLRQPSEDRVCIPRSLCLGDITDRLHPTVTDEDMEMFRNALSHMTSLKKFSWMQLLGSSPWQGIMDISDTLVDTAHCLEALCVNIDTILTYNSVLTLEKDRLPLQNLSIWTLTGLTKVILSSAVPAAVTMIVQHCPDIKDLALSDLSVTSIIPLMQHANWKNLRRLRLSTHILAFMPSAPQHGSSKSITSFFDRHSNIECLSLNLCEILFPMLPSSFLLKLRSVSVPEDVLTSLLSRRTISRLEHWRCRIELESPDIYLLPRMEKLQSAYITIVNEFLLDFLGPFLTNAPNLKKLYLDLYDVGSYEDIKSQEEIIDLFLQCPNLTHILCDFPLPIETLDAVSFHVRLASVCKRLSRLRNLKYLQFLFNDQQWPVWIERDKRGKYSGYKLVKSEEVENPMSWGGLYFH